MHSIQLSILKSAFVNFKELLFVYIPLQPMFFGIVVGVTVGSAVLFVCETEIVVLTA